MRALIQAIRGMNDILPNESSIWQQAEARLRHIFYSHCYQEIRFPIIEKTDLFKRSIGEVTDIIEKEMYTFLDRNGDSLSLRPEGTACCVRAGIEHGLLYNQIQRLWYMGPYFRHERPQRGRYRQFHQCSAEVFGLTGPDIDAEIILLSSMMLKNLGILSYATLEINSLGSSEARKHYREQLIQYFTDHQHQLDEDSNRRLHTNPMRILDSKNAEMQKLISHAPKLTDHLDEESSHHFQKLQNILNQVGITFKVNPCLVRGLDYYNKTVFEWTTNHLGAQGTICAGGRYDSLVEQLGGNPTPAVGFSLGMERAILLMQEIQAIQVQQAVEVYLITEEATFAHGLKLANYLRHSLPGLRLMLHSGGGTLKNQFKKADKSGARYAIILGEEEIKTQTILIKALRENIPQQRITEDKLTEYLHAQITTK